MSIKAKIGAFLCASCLFAFPQLATAANTTGAIRKIYVSTPTNLPFRIFLDTATTCKGGFFYVDGSSANYQVYVSALMLAYSQNKAISLSYDIDANDYCYIRDVGVG